MIFFFAYIIKGDDNSDGPDITIGLSIGFAAFFTIIACIILIVCICCCAGNNSTSHTLKFLGKEEEPR